MPGFLGPFHCDNWDSAKAVSGWVWPRPLGAQKSLGRGRLTKGSNPAQLAGLASRKARGPPPPWRAPRDCAADGTSVPRPCGPGRARTPRPAPALLLPRRRLRPGRAGGSRGARGRRVGGRKEDLQQYLWEEAAGAAAAAAAGGGGRGEGGGARALPLPLSPAPDRPGPAPRTAPRAPGGAASPYLAAPGCPPLAKATYIPGKLARGPGANPQTKSETSAGLERLLVGAFPPPSSPPSPPPPLGLPCGALRAGS